MFELFENFPFLVVMIFVILFRVLSARAKQQKRGNDRPPRNLSGPFKPLEKAGNYEDKDEDDKFFPGKSPFPADIFHEGPVLREGESALPPLEKTVIAAARPAGAPGLPKLPPRPLPVKPPLTVQSAVVLSPAAAPAPGALVYGEAGGEGGWGGKAFPGSLDYLPPLKRAIVLSEIFGPPKGFNP
jgi:hypothetical protein